MYSVNKVFMFRDEEREKDEAEKERRRQERKEKELKRELEKADQPKREVKRKTEWTVEFIKVIFCRRRVYQNNEDDLKKNFYLYQAFKQHGCQ